VISVNESRDAKLFGCVRTWHIRVFFSHGSLQNQAAGSQDADVLRLQAQQLRQENDQLKV